MTQVINSELIDILKPFFVSRSEWYNQIVSVGGGDIRLNFSGHGSFLCYQCSKKVIL